MTGSPGTSVPRLDRRDLVLAASAVAAAAVARVVYLAWMGLPRFDPWRHLQLIENLRAGKGFTLFAGQPYIWYHPLWYRLCALAPRSIGPDWIAGAFSALSVGLLYLWLRLRNRPSSRSEAAAAALMAAAFGPLIAFTCHYGSESFAVFLMLLSFCAIEAGPSIPGGASSGIFWGLAAAARLNLAWTALVPLIAARGRRRKLAFLLGAAVPLGLSWLRNRAAIGAHPFLFTWDGIAARAADFTPVSSLAVQLHPTVREALRGLHAQTVAAAEWIRTPDGIAWGSVLFLAAALAGLPFSRKRAVAMAAFLSFVSMAVLDPTGSGRYFRPYVGLFPLFFAILAGLAGRVAAKARRRPGPVLAAAAAFVVLCGAASFFPQPAVPIEMVTPPPGFLAESGYLVNSGFFHPESLIRAYPEKSFVGLPLAAAEFAEFRRAFPGYRFVLWHRDFSVQDGLAAHLAAAGLAVPRGSAVNVFGRRYEVFELMDR